MVNGLGEPSPPNAVWPHPQQIQVTGTGLLYLKPKQLTINSNLDECIIIKSAKQRYENIFFPPTFTIVNPPSNEGILESLTLTVENKVCEESLTLMSDESYKLTIKDKKADIEATNVWGILRGIETFSQLLFINNDNQLVVNDTVTIIDSPRFRHRGLMLDTARHFLPVPILKKNLGAYSQDHVYTLKDVQEIIEFARLRGIRVIPEFDTPGHTFSWSKSHPDLITDCWQDGKPNQAIYSVQGEREIFDVTKPIVYEIMEKLLNEIHEVFLEKYMHLDIGLIPVVWQDVWDEHVKLPSDTIIQIWKDESISAEFNSWASYLNKAASEGYNVILSSPWYLNFISYGKYNTNDSVMNLDFFRYYEVEPLQTFSGNDAEKRRILGGEACLWAEFVDGSNVIPRLWPVASAIAERLWSDRSVNNSEDAQFRLDVHRCRLLRRGISAQPILTGYCGNYEPDHLKLPPAWEMDPWICNHHDGRHHPKHDHATTENTSKKLYRSEIKPLWDSDLEWTCQHGKRRTDGTSFVKYNTESNEHRHPSGRARTKRLIPHSLSKVLPSSYRHGIDYTNRKSDIRTPLIIPKMSAKSRERWLRVHAAYLGKWPYRTVQERKAHKRRKVKKCNERPKHFSHSEYDATSSAISRWESEDERFQQQLRVLPMLSGTAHYVSHLKTMDIDKLSTSSSQQGLVKQKRKRRGRPKTAYNRIVSQIEPLPNRPSTGYETEDERRRRLTRRTSWLSSSDTNITTTKSKIRIKSGLLNHLKVFVQPQSQSLSRTSLATTIPSINSQRNIESSILKKKPITINIIRDDFDDKYVGTEIAKSHHQRQHVKIYDVRDQCIQADIARPYFDLNYDYDDKMIGTECYYDKKIRSPNTTHADKSIETGEDFIQHISIDNNCSSLSSSKDKTKQKIFESDNNEKRNLFNNNNTSSDKQGQSVQHKMSKNANKNKKNSNSTTNSQDILSKNEQYNVNNGGDTNSRGQILPLNDIFHTTSNYLDDNDKKNVNAHEQFRR
ncbi:unnamed protein product [Didymodactylos carnosus]|uniref:beta-N-acetylhexosaminidase n=1 Tax=Didymodactylos carnosus TaxID=1234261 RepID=A0A8S2L3U0_9BILA|nr:unnamed protein product [Didymodactylos carnosus]CAF3878589.1 unnamed protein product [Didymodactylos carnosus]